MKHLPDMSLESVPPIIPPEVYEDYLRLPVKQRAFVAEYLQVRNGTQAAIAAGYSAKTADVKASQLLRLVKVREIVDAVDHVALELAGVTQLWWVEQLKRLAESNVRHYVIDETEGAKLRDGVPDEAWQAVSSIKLRETVVEDDEGGREVQRTMELKLWSKPEALRQLGQYLGMFKVEGGAPTSPLIVGVYQGVPGKSELIEVRGG